MLTPTLKEDGNIGISVGDESIGMSADELDQFMKDLADLRAQMTDRVPDQQKRIVRVSVNPLYNVRLDKESKTCLLSLRHPGLGWLNFELPAQEVLNMRTMWNHIVDKMDLEPPAAYYEGPDRRRSQPH